MGNENTSSSGGSSVAGSDVNSGDTISQTEFDNIIEAMKTVLTHTHIFYDDYGTNCNCNCDCTRGTWG